jgi:2-methylcitrate dehydratase PrpD
MKAALDALAEFVQSGALTDPPRERFELLKRHVLDSVGARLAGSRTDEGIAAARAAGVVKEDLIAAIVAGCAQTRCTEIDDVHLTSCTTPGAVVVQTALAFAASGELRSMRAFTAASLAGYEALIRLGVGIDGPRVLHEGVWPTHRAAAFGSATVAARAYGLTARQTAAALSTALGLGAATLAAAAPAMSSRWFALGIAAADGVLAARGAREGLVGTAGLSSARLTNGLGRKWLFDEIGLKPYPTARQALAAIEAARELAEGLDASDLRRIRAITVGVPERQRKVVDRPDLPRTRFASIVSVQYQIALALAEPARIVDVRRTPPFTDDRVRRLMSTVRVRRARDLDASYPRAFPAKVAIVLPGRRLSLLVRHPRGDHRNPLGWDDVAVKFRATTGLSPDRSERMIDAIRSATLESHVPPLWEMP